LKEIPFGELLTSATVEELLTLSLEDDECIVWRETSRGAEAVLLGDKYSFPKNWGVDVDPWKIIGTEGAIRATREKKKIPVGSKVIVTQGRCDVMLNLGAGQVKFSGQRRKRVVIVDDSPTMRKLLRHIISSYQDWEVVAEVERGEDLLSAINLHFPDLITLDLHLGSMDGLEVMKKYISPKKLPTILITSQPKDDGSLVMDTLSEGALDYMQKPESGSWETHSLELLAKMESALQSKMALSNTTSQVWKAPAFSFSSTGDHLLVIGSSTGGTQALQEIFLNLPKEIPPILVVQHIPAGFSRALAERLNKLCPFEVKEAEEGDQILPNRILIAPGGKHMELSRSGLHVTINEKEPMNRFRPSVDVLFNSIIPNKKKKVIALILTGMGKDGAQGMKTLHDHGARTIVQDEASSVVFGMPKEAIRLGAADRVENLRAIAAALVEETKEKNMKQVLHKPGASKLA
jgi:two-component system, chemotaxis family, protein-glutamate methylesterase/glutaminase